MSMRRGFAYHFTPAREARLREFWPTNEPLTLLAVEWGCSTAYVSIKAKQLGLPSRINRRGEIRKEAMRTCPMPREHKPIGIENHYMRREALVRGLSVVALREQLLDVIAKDRLVAAILDDVPDRKVA